MHLTYSYFCAQLCIAHADLRWADEQYLCGITSLLSEYAKFFEKKEKKKADASSMKKFIRKED